MEKTVARILFRGVFSLSIPSLAFFFFHPSPSISSPQSGPQIQRRRMCDKQTFLGQKTRLVTANVVVFLFNEI